MAFNCGICHKQIVGEGKSTHYQKHKDSVELIFTVGKIFPNGEPSLIVQKVDNVGLFFFKILPRVGLNIFSVIPKSRNEESSTTPNLQVLSPLYDLTPPTCITAVVTEVGLIPPSSISSIPMALGRTLI